MMGGCVCIKFWWVKNWVNEVMVLDCNFSKRVLSGVFGCKCGKVWRYLGVWYFFWMGNVWRVNC